jgi:glycosyltransferase involved in cell wall biosynthesis
LGGKESIELGISSKLYEYQAAGKPILCCSRGQPGLYVTKSKSGIVIEPGDYEGLAKSILFLFENPEKAQELGENGRSYVERNHSVTEIGLKMKALIVKILKGGGRNERS